MQKDFPDFHTRGYLPHLENRSLQVITFRLYDAVPRHVIDSWMNELSDLYRMNDSSVSTQLEARRKLRKQIDNYEDHGYGQCFLRDERIANFTERALFCYDNQYYRLLRWVIMPNHVHVLIDKLPGHSLSTIVQNWKSLTAHQANQLLGRRGVFWMAEYYDRYVRNEEHLSRVIAYIDANPVKAGLADSPSAYRWSSAYYDSIDRAQPENPPNG